VIFEKVLVIIKMRPLNILYYDYAEHINLSFKQQGISDSISKLIEKYITDFDEQNKIYDLIGHSESIVCEEAFRAGFIAGAYPLQRVY
jgi:hypothetical protein